MSRTGKDKTISYKRKVSVFVPAHNEEKTLPILYGELRKLMDSEQNYEWEILIVNDGSTDGTLSVVKKLREKEARVHYVSLSRNFGKESAMLVGFDYVSGDCMVIMDADMQDPPSLKRTVALANIWHRLSD